MNWTLSHPISALGVQLIPYPTSPCFPLSQKELQGTTPVWQPLGELASTANLSNQAPFTHRGTRERTNTHPSIPSLPPSPPPSRSSGGMAGCHRPGGPTPRGLGRRSSCPPAPRGDGRSPRRREADEKLSKSIRAHFLDGLIPMQHETPQDG